MKYPFIQSGGGATPLMYACQQCRESEVLDIITRQPLAVEERDRTLKTPLHYCAQNENTNCAEAILKVAPELVNSQDVYGYCTLHLAIIAGNLLLIKLLISKGADVNLYDDEGHSPVHWAVVSGENDALDEIIRAGADPSIPDIHGGYPLHYAVQMCGSNYEITRKLCDAVKVVHKLLFYGVNVNVIDKDARQPILWAASAGSAQIIKDLINHGAKVDACDKDGLTALHCAASRGHTETIEILVNGCGAEVDIIDGNGCSSLFYAVTLGHADATAMLLQLGAQPNRQDRKGRTPAHCGAAKGQLETLKILEKFNGNLWIKNVKGDYPLHEAVTSGRKDLIQWFLEKNPEAINVGNNDGRCLLHVAVMYNHINVLKMLLENKCLVNPVMRSTKGVLMTPLNVALCKGHRSCAKLLQLHGGVPFSKVTKPDSYFENQLRISPLRSKSDRERASLKEENISPSFTIIKTSIGDDSDGFGINYDRKKVYRRRKKRKSNKSEKKSERVESDSEDSIIDQKVKIASRENLKVLTAEDAVVNVEEKKANNEYIKTTSATVFDNKKNILRTSSAILKLEQSAESDNFSTTKSSQNVFEKMSSLSPENLPFSSRQINLADSEIARLKSDEAETSVKSENIEKKEKVSDLNMMAIDKAIDFKQNEIIESETQKKEIGKDEKENVQTFEDVQSKEKNQNVSQNLDSFEETKESEKNNLQEEIPIEKKEKTEIIRSKVVTVRKSEKTTKTIMKTEKKSENENPDEQNDKPIKSIEEKMVSKENSSIEEPEKQKPKNTKPAFKVLKSEIDFEAKDENKNVKKSNGDLEERSPTKETFLIVEKTKTKPFDNSDAEIQKEVVFAEVHELGLPTKNSFEQKENDTNKNILLETVEEVSKSNKSDKQNGFHKETETLPYKEKIVLIASEEVRKPEAEENALFLRNSESMPDLIALDDGNNNEKKDSILDIQLPPIIIPGPSATTSQAHQANSTDENKSILPELSDSDLIKNQNGTEKDKKAKRKLMEEKEALTSGKSSESADELIEEFEPSSINCPNRNNWLVRNGRLEGAFPGKMTRPCRKTLDFQRNNEISINQFVQNAVRKYHLERGIFHQLLELKRLQIRAGRANEQVLVKRLVDEYERTCACLGTRHYGGAYKFKELEKFLYDQLRFINKGRLTLPKIKSYDDIDTLSEVLKKSRCELMSEVLPEKPQCACLTQRCHHSTKAYTTLPCSAYVARIRRSKTPRRKKERFLPDICQNQTGKYGDRLATLELVQGNDKQVIELPPTHGCKNKKYFITFTIQSAHTFKGNEFLEKENDFYEHRHAKSV